MRITIVGAGPVGLLVSCLTSKQHVTTVLDKRTQPTRDHGLTIKQETIDTVLRYLESDSRLIIARLRASLQGWSGNVVRTADIENELSEIAILLGVIIRRGTHVTSIDFITDSIIIGADGAHSIIRQLVFGNELADQKDIQYMAQLKYQTPEVTRPRKTISALIYSSINGITGSDMVLDFESLAPPKEPNLIRDLVDTPMDNLMKPGTLHVPIPHSVYAILSANDRGTFVHPWSLEELANIKNDKVAKLLRIIRRYEFSLQWRRGWLYEPKVSVIPLAIYRSAQVVKFTDTNKLVLLVGDASSGLIYEKGLNKGWLEAVKCSNNLMDVSERTLAHKMDDYSQYCKNLYHQESAEIISKHRKIESANTSIAGSSMIGTLGLGILLNKIFG